jgi:hypothetical protein
MSKMFDLHQQARHEFPVLSQTHLLPFLLPQLVDSYKIHRPASSRGVSKIVDARKMNTSSCQTPYLPFINIIFNTLG